MRVRFLVSLIFIFIVLNSNRLLSQSYYQPGTIIASDNSEKKGFIDTGGLNKRPYTIHFRENDTSAILTFTPLTIKGFKTGGDYYISAIVMSDTSPRSVSELLKKQIAEIGMMERAFNESNNISVQRITPDGPVRVESGDTIMTLEPVNVEVDVFLKALVIGRKNLLTYTDTDFKQHFYISDGMESCQELNRVFYTNDFTDQLQVYNWQTNRFITVYEIEFYKTQLLKIMSDRPDMSESIGKLKYTQKALENIVLEYNSSFSDSTGILLKSSSKMVYSFGIFAGAGATKLSFEGDESGHPVSAIDFDNALSYNIGSYGEVIFPKYNHRFSLYTLLSMNYFMTKGSGTTVIGSVPYYSEIEILSARLTPMIRYRLLKGDLVPFVSMGAFFTYNIKEFDSIINLKTGDINPALEEMKKGQQGFVAGAGLLFKNGGIELRFEKGNGYSNYISLSGSETTFSFSLFSAF